MSDALESWPHFEAEEKRGPFSMVVRSGPPTVATRSEARRMWAAGVQGSTIAWELNVAPSTVAYWCADLPKRKRSLKSFDLRGLAR